MDGLAELHTHLGGSVASEILWSLAHEQGIALPVKDFWEFHSLVTVSDAQGAALCPVDTLASTHDLGLDDCSTATFQSTASARNMTPNAAVLFPLPSPVLTARSSYAMRLLILIGKFNGS